MMTLIEFLNLLFCNQYIFISFILIILVIMVNGWTDAPNAITSCIVTKTLPVKKAITLSVICNFLGIIIMSTISNEVIDTISNIAYFPKDNNNSLIAICAGMFSVVLWAVITWYFGIPTSESHALISGITGAAIALNNGFSGINEDEWIKVLFGLLISFIFGIFLTIIVTFIFKMKTFRDFKTKKIQIFLTSFLSFLHGAQDGQKFIGVFIILLGLGFKTSITTIPLWAIITAAAFMGIGTSLGGKKIIEKIGYNLMEIDKIEGITIDFVSCICILSTTLLGLPISTTHIRTISVIGIGMSNSRNKINFKIIKELVIAWILTFPCCGIIGYLVSSIMISIF